MQKRERMLKKIAKYGIRKIQFIITDILHRDTLKLFYFRGRHNFGDVINPIVFEYFSGKKVSWVEPEYYNEENYLAIGSILEFASKDSIVWGSGFISKEGKPHAKPKKICAVRGPLTRELLLKQNINCPEVYGDPALLLPKIYNPTQKKRYKLGIVPHYVDKGSQWLERVQDDPDVKILDIQMHNPFAFIDALVSCEKIASSSLHGIIVADAYNIPSTWIQFSKKLTGGDFKFLDYFQSVKREDTEPLVMKEDTTTSEIYESFYEYSINIDLDALVAAFPKSE